MEVLKPFRLKVVESILQGYNGQLAFHLYFTQLCQQYRQWGSKDRKIYKSICYAYFRLGYAVKNRPLQEGIAMAVEAMNVGFDHVSLNEVFPHHEWLSPQYESLNWLQGLLFQKPVYLSVLPKHLQTVKQYLMQNGHTVVFEQDYCIGLEPNTNCEEIIKRGWAWIMDLSSQQIASMVTIHPGDAVWDACAGAGGKSLYLSAYIQTPFELTCSDKRLSVLENLKQRFKGLQLNPPRVELCDLTQGFQLSNSYDVIVLDVPCSGSGTWGRTPEHIAHFDLTQIERFQTLQQNLFAQAIKHLKPNGRLYYMTCSVFKAENEDNVAYWLKHYDLKAQKQSYAFSQDASADVLFCAELMR